MFQDFALDTTLPIGHKVM